MYLLRIAVPEIKSKYHRKIYKKGIGRNTCKKGN